VGRSQQRGWRCSSRYRRRPGRVPGRSGTSATVALRWARKQGQRHQFSTFRWILAGHICILLEFNEWNGACATPLSALGARVERGLPGAGAARASPRGGDARRKSRRTQRLARGRWHQMLSARAVGSASRATAHNTAPREAERDQGRELGKGRRRRLRMGSPGEAHEPVEEKSGAPEHSRQRAARNTHMAHAAAIQSADRL
jgi:hypothetical protein